MNSKFLIFAPDGSEPEEMIYAIKSGDQVEVRVNGSRKTTTDLFKMIFRSICPKDRFEKILFLIIMLDFIEELKESEEISNG